MVSFVFSSGYLESRFLAGQRGGAMTPNIKKDRVERSFLIWFFQSYPFDFTRAVVSASP
jgi:hypothetical protein